MINIKAFLKNGDCIGLESEDHADYDEWGKDIVCAGVSALMINLANSLEVFTDDSFALETDEAYLYIMLDEAPSKSAKLLLSSCLLGLENIQKDYKDYINIIKQEVK